MNENLAVGAMPLPESGAEKKAANNSRLLPGEYLPLGCFFGYQRTGCLTRLRIDDAHFMPVIGEFLAAVQADHVCPRASSRLYAARATTDRDRKTIARMPASKKSVR